MRIIERLARYYEEGMTSRRAALETGLLLSHVRDKFREFHTLGLPRRTRRILEMDFYARSAPYEGPIWIGEAIGSPPVPFGEEWIGQSTETSKSVH